MKKYKIKWSEDKHVIIEAENEEDAVENFIAWSVDTTLIPVDRIIGGRKATEIKQKSCNN